MNDSPTPQKLRWFQFGLRDILWLTIAFALLLGWWNDHKRLSATAETSAKDADNERARSLVVQNELTAARDEAVAAAEQALQVTQRFNEHLRRSTQRAIVCRFLETPNISGLVTSTIPERGVAEINLGLDHGLRLGDRLHVIRLTRTSSDSKYCGQIQLIAVNKTTASGKLLPGTNSEIERDDTVVQNLE